MSSSSRSNLFCILITELMSLFSSKHFCTSFLGTTNDSLYEPKEYSLIRRRSDFSCFFNRFCLFCSIDAILAWSLVTYAAIHSFLYFLNLSSCSISKLDTVAFLFLLFKSPISAYLLYYFSVLRITRATTVISPTFSQFGNFCFKIVYPLFF